MERKAHGPAGPWDVNTVAKQLARSRRCTVEEVTLQVARNIRQMLADRHL